MVVKQIVIVTDCMDIAFEQVKARLVSLLPNININFFNLITPAFNIKNGLFLSKLISEELPMGEDTLFLAIINPLKTKPKRIFGKLKNGSWFVGADTGIFSLLFDEFGIAEVYESKEQKHYPFGGLHVHTTIAGKLLKGVLADEIGNKINVNNIERISPTKGEVLHIDNFGLIKTWMKTQDLNLEEGQKVRIKVKNSNRVFEGIFSNRMMDLDDGCLVVYPGSSLLDKALFNNIDEYRKSGLIEIGIVRRQESAKELGIKLEDIIEIESIEKFKAAE